MKPQIGEYEPYYKRYIDMIPSDNIIEVLENQIKDIEELIKYINEEKSYYRYAENKWSIKEILGHLIDTERVMTYRALRISRKDSNPLAKFDQNLFIKESNFDSIPLKLIAEELLLIRKSTILMFKGMTESMMLNRGILNGHDITARALAYIIAGHTFHHLQVIKERYL